MRGVTSKTFAERLLRSAEQAAAIKQKSANATRVGRHKVTAREVIVRQPPK